MNFIGLLLALISGLFFVIGFLIANKAKNKEKLSCFAISLAFVIMLNLIIFDLIPEVLEIFNRKLWIALIFIIIGMVVLKVLDIFIPDHHHDHEEGDNDHLEHKSHIYHIGIVTLISLLLHNIIEGMAIYGLTKASLESGLFMCMGVALHNIPLGIQIAVLLSNIKTKKISNKTLLTILSLSSLIGGLIVSLFGNIHELFLGIITSITLGMIIYITILELLPEIIHNHKHKEVYYGIITGVIIIIFSMLL